MAKRKSKPATVPHAKTPKPRFMMLGKSKWVHVVRTAAYDRKHSECQQVRKYMVAEKINYKDKGLSPEAASALDACPNCGTAEVLAGLTDTPEARKEKSADFMHRMREENRPKTGKGKAKKVKGNLTDPDGSKRKARKAGGMRSSGDSTKEKADTLVAFAIESGWDANAVIVEGEPGILVQAARDNEVIQCWFVDGKYDSTRPASVTVGSWSGKLRGVHGCRKQMANEGRDRPHPEPGKGRSAPRGKSKKTDEQPEDVVPEDESPEDARKRVPFLIDDDDATIIEAIKGKTIRWRNGLSGQMHEAQLPGKVKGAKRDLIVIDVHPKTGKKVVDFLEVVGRDEGRDVYGPERIVALDKIVRLIG